MKNKFEVRGENVAIFVNSKGVVKEVLVDLEDFELVSSMPKTWSVRTSGTKTIHEYIYTRTTKQNKPMIYLHRLIMNPPKDMVIDHINGNTFDNRRCNLRIITKGQNNQNKNNISTKSGVRGVTWNKRSNFWQASYRLNGKTCFVGLFEDIKEAEKAVVEARKNNMPYSET